MKVFLLPLSGGDSVFYSEAEAEAPDPAPTHAGLRGWVERSTQRVRSALRHPKGPVGQKLKRAWDWLQRRMYPDEELLASLRLATSIDLHHCRSVTAAEAQRLWVAYLRRRLGRHIPWLLFDAVLAVLTVALAPLPGPNLICYWFAYRAVRHVLILLGIRRALTGRVETMFHPVHDLDPSGDCADEQWRTRAVELYALRGLHEFVARIAPVPDAAETATATATVTVTAASESAGDETGGAR